MGNEWETQARVFPYFSADERRTQKCTNDENMTGVLAATGLRQVHVGLESPGKVCQSTGSSIDTVVAVGSDARLMRPPCASIIDRVIDKPSPAPSP